MDFVHFLKWLLFLLRQHNTSYIDLRASLWPFVFSHNFVKTQTLCFQHSLNSILKLVLLNNFYMSDPVVG